MCSRPTGIPSCPMVSRGSRRERPSSSLPCLGTIRSPPPPKRRATLSASSLLRSCCPLESRSLSISPALVLTGLVRYDTLNNAAPVAAAFTAIGLPWVTFIVSAAAVAGIASVMLAFLLGCARIWFAMSRDGLLPAWFAQVHPRFKTPHRPTLIAGSLTALVAGFFPIKAVAELVNIGTLSAFVIICFAVLVLRRTKPNARRTFRTPFVPWIPLFGIGFSIWLLSKLPAPAWRLFVIWMALGLLIYFSYGVRHSALARQKGARHEEN